MRKGFTLIELMLAVVILSIGISALLRSYLSLAGAFGTAHRRLAVLAILQDKGADLEALVFDGQDPSQAAERTPLERPGLSGEYELATQPLVFNDSAPDEAQTPGQPLPGIEEAVLSFSWQDSRGPQSVKLVTAFLNTTIDHRP